MPSYGLGWEAIDSALARLHGKAEHVVFRSPVPPEADPKRCKMVAAWKGEGGLAHWHLVTYGLTELFRKASDHPNQSGWGHELTMRIPRVGNVPPGWPIELLRFLVDTV